MFFKQLSELRKIFGLNKSQFAKIMDISSNSYTDYENKTNPSKPSIAVLESLKANRPEVDLNWLFTGKGEPFLEVPMEARVQEREYLGVLVYREAQDFLRWFRFQEDKARAGRIIENIIHIEKMGDFKEQLITLVATLLAEKGDMEDFVEDTMDSLKPANHTSKD